MAAVGGGNSAQSDRLASGYAERMTAGGAWINISAADLSAQVAWASEGASWCEHACTTAVYNRRDLYDSLGGTMSDPIHAASDRVVSAQRDIADSTEALHKWWKFVEGQVEGTKYLIRNAVDLAMQEIETIENAPGVKAEDKNSDRQPDRNCPRRKRQPGERCRGNDRTRSTALLHPSSSR